MTASIRAFVDSVSLQRAATVRERTPGLHDAAKNSLATELAGVSARKKYALTYAVNMVHTCKRRRVR